MIIIGVNFGHDSSVAIVKNGKLLAAIEEEKVSRIKQDFGWPKKAIARLFLEHSIKPEEVSVIAFDLEIPFVLGKDEIKFRFTKGRSSKNLEYINRITSYLGFSKRKIGKSNQEVILDTLKTEGYVNAKVLFYDHHLSHAASAYYTSPILCNLIITSDGKGGNSSFNFYIPTSSGLKLIRKNDHTVSVGAFYSMITKLLGFRPTRHEGKITGLAAYGKKTDLVDKFEKLYYYDQGSLRRFPDKEMEKLWNHYKLDNALSTIEKINLKQSSNDVANDYAKRNAILLAWLKENTKGYLKEDIAYACQHLAEKVTLDEINIVIKEYFRDEPVSVGLAGGVFANVRINQKIYELEGVENIFVQPAMGDSGLALGNAILAEIENNSKDYLDRSFVFSNTFLGPNYISDLKNFVLNFDDSEVVMEEMAEPAKIVANLLNKNKIIGFWSGSMEWGPRALGSRTIMLNTFDKQVNDTLNSRLNRTEFMPFAPVVLDFKAKTYFPKYDSAVPAADYMTMTYDTAPEYHKELQAVVHVDGTARPQIAYKEITPLYYQILLEFDKLTGCGALVNTSFNAHEEPILSDPSTAINALKNNRVDYLVMENYLFRLK